MLQPKRSTYTAPTSVIKEIRESGGGDEEDPFAATKRARIIDREDEYRKRRMDQVISPARVDPFANGGATPDINSR